MVIQRDYRRKYLTGMLIIGVCSPGVMLTVLVTTAQAQQFIPSVPVSIRRLGPVDPANGFPLWAEDANGTILELCLSTAQQADPMAPGFFCPTCIDPALDLPDPLSPLSFPTNFPPEAFFMAIDALMPTNNGGGAAITLALEAAFDALGEPIDGEQIVFSRLRIRIDNAMGGETYTITHPYGKVIVIADGAGPRGINITNDVFLWKGQNLAVDLKGNFGVFPVALTAPPDARFLGDFCLGEDMIDTHGDGQPEIFRIEGTNIGDPRAANLCADITLGPDPLSFTDCVETTLFALTGKKAERFGGAVTRATLNKDATSTQINVWAQSLANQNMVLSVAGKPDVAMVGDGQGNYFANIVEISAFPAPSTITVTNLTDVPPQVVSAPLIDNVLIATAVYDVAAQSLTVQANSSNANIVGTSLSLGGSPLDANGFGQILGVVVPPASISIDSVGGGTTTVPVQVFGVVPMVRAVAGGTQVVPLGSPVTLDASLSVGLNLSYLWTQTGGTPVVLTGANTATPGFTFPATTDLLTFDLTVTDGNGLTSSDVVTVTNPALAVAGPDQTFLTYPTGGVTVDGSASVGANLSYSWSQLAGPTAVLDAPNSAVASFAFPLVGGNVVFELVVSGPGGSSSSLVSITSPPGVPVADAGPSLSVFTSELVQLDGSGSQGLIDQFVWTAPAGVALGCLLPDGTVDVNPLTCDLNRTDPAFIFPSVPQTLTFSLTVIGPGGPSAPTTVDIISGNPMGADELVITRAQFKAGKGGEWRIEGTSSIPGPGHTVSAWIDTPVDANLIGTGAVDAVGAFKISCKGACPDPATSGGSGPPVLLLRSTLGGTTTCTSCF